MSKWKIVPSPFTHGWWHLYRKGWFFWKWVDCGPSREEMRQRAKELSTPPETFDL